MSAYTLVQDETSDNNGLARFTAIGIGGGGGNSIEHMVRSGIKGVAFACANTDRQALDRMSAPNRIQLGLQTSRGLGAGADPQVGRLAAQEEHERIRETLQGSDMVFITAGMGGGTGTGAAPVVAEIAKEMGILTVAVVTTPFQFEGKRRLASAQQGIEDLSQYVDSLITIPNDKLMSVYRNLSVVDAFKRADDVVLNAVRGISDLIINPGMINIDFADIRAAMTARGHAMMGIGTAKGDDRARIATEMAIRSPLLDNVLLEGAQGLLVNITAADVKLDEFQTVGEVIAQIADEDANIFVGMVVDPDAGEELRITVIATGLSRDDRTAPRRPVPTRKDQVSLPLDDADAPAIDRRHAGLSEPLSAATEAAPTAASPIRIQDFLKNQQKR
ncbi:cell division protein FtsZ [Aquirhabdus parva]|uniref:Cell division protein FtsZ n=1 Tax=Aquirhabdus parva TaxID=2283318 RepID=A0A345P2U7_9GAMM|nr:cell division protein FtsZ [Aquirhabdus parva]AXI01606.1 cell division protein FtsZ [Aquirhabdus parva]